MLESAKVASLATMSRTRSTLDAAVGVWPGPA